MARLDLSVDPDALRPEDQSLHYESWEVVGNAPFRMPGAMNEAIAMDVSEGKVKSLSMKWLNSKCCPVVAAGGGRRRRVSEGQ
jgi:hypothetical protein